MGTPFISEVGPVSGNEFYRGQRDPAREIAQQLDFGNGREVANVLQDIYRTDRHAFGQLAQQINRNERNNRGDDLTITDNGQVYVGHRGQQERVGQIDDFRSRGQGNWNYQNGGMRDNHRHNNGRGGINVDIDISPDPYPGNGGWGNGRNGYPEEQIYRSRPPVYRYPDYDRIPSNHRNGNNGEVIGTIAGGVAGGIIGSRGERDNTLTGALIGALGGNMIGRQIDRNNNRQQDYRWHR